MMVKQLSDKKVFKIVIAGDGATGKTTISKRLNGSLNSEEKLQMTTAIEFHSFEITEKDGKAVIWDLAGQEQFRSFQDTFFADADIIILVYSVEWFPSYMNIDSWFSMVNTERVSKFYLLANKVDIKNRAIRKDEGIEYAKSKGMTYFELSAKTGEGFKEFQEDLLRTGKILTSTAEDQTEQSDLTEKDEFIEISEDIEFKSFRPEYTPNDLFEIVEKPKLKQDEDLKDKTFNEN
ncbi:MAG: GTP-binding protein [Candidatus Lokiarchaeota archaeon]|nr:GTP-binding protein [Candidatus Lokiarchaeota archaeon]MBD3199506.1 GTP-binding protein [Candidatus Lokiarchaeota archaeon]